jgi:hypothetical protein
MTGFITETGSQAPKKVMFTFFVGATELGTDDDEAAPPKTLKRTKARMQSRITPIAIGMIIFKGDGFMVTGVTFRGGS